MKLISDGGATRVEILHSGLPEIEAEKHARPGWPHFLGRARPVVPRKVLDG